MYEETLINVVLLVMVTATAVGVARVRNLFAASMLSGLYSLLMALLWLNMYALDVAFTEAAVGAGISTVLFLGALSHTGTEERPGHNLRGLGLVVVLMTGAVLVYGTLDMPRFGDPRAPIHGHLAPEYIGQTVGEAQRRKAAAEDAHGAQGERQEKRAPGHSGKGGEEHADFHELPNMVTTLLASYRGYDTMGEVAVIFTAGMGVLLLLGARGRGRRDHAGGAADTDEDTAAAIATDTNENTEADAASAPRAPNEPTEGKLKEEDGA